MKMLTRKQEIDYIVEGLIESVGSSDLKDIISSLDIKLITKNGITTQYIKRKDGKQIIYLDTSLPEEIKPFVLAHEIGHAVLHDEEIIQYSPFDIVRTKVEREADYFAFKLLCKSIDPIYNFTAEQYAKMLGVNEEVIEYMIDRK